MEVTGGILMVILGGGTGDEWAIFPLLGGGGGGEGEKVSQFGF